ncbi:MAG TPA: hypothetical protein VK866_04195, partial [Acidimicrobiales bacterium]|nr:hypothetical protein [Acidimicrobiales bacterium]
MTYEGPRLEELLERVQRELGSGATIVEANRRRRGGIAGFFATEWFEVVATADADAVSAAAGPVPEPEDPPPARSVAASAPPPVRRSTRPAASDTDDPLMALVAAVNAAERPREAEVEDAGAPPVPTAETVRANARALLALAPRHGFRAESTPTWPQADDEPEVDAEDSPPRRHG